MSPLDYSASGLPNSILAVAVSPRAEFLASSALFSGVTLLWDGANGQVLGELPAGEVYPAGLAFSADGTLLATASRAEGLIVWDVNAKAWGTLAKRMAGPAR